ncbi:UNVERIFIED_CONTAM: hypothetical protein GTU68_047467 [Idotea baltica]|nr:hypothetical protein [Idotea baltica]
MLFKDLGLSAELLRAVEKKGYDEATPIQQQAIPLVLAGKDVLAGAQTGTGKTAGFTLPVLQCLQNNYAEGHKRHPKVLVLTPTRELAAQVHESVRDYGQYLPFRSAVIFGGVSINPQKQKLIKGVDIVVATPGRLLDHLAKDGITSAAIHGNKSQGARTKALANFKAGDVRVLVATDIAARGIDIDKLPHVVNFELPNVPADYVHRIGRTARAGQQGHAVSLVCVDELKLLRDIEKLLGKEIEKVNLPGYDIDPTIKAEPIVNGRGGRNNGGNRGNSARGRGRPSGNSGKPSARGNRNGGSRARSGGGNQRTG